MIKKTNLFILALFSLFPILHSQELKHDAIVINIEVPVRVFKGDVFVDNLRIDNFEIYENGELQRVEAVYLIRKTKIKREEIGMQPKQTRSKNRPVLNRHFVMIFELNRILPETEDAIRYFFGNVVMSSDKLTVITPIKTYRFREISWLVVPRVEMANQLIKILREDIFAMYESWGNPVDFQNDISTGDLGREIQISNVGNRYLNEDRLISVAENLKRMPGQKNVFLFLQQDLIYSPMPQTSNSIAGIFTDLNFLDYMSTVAGHSLITPQKIKKAFADSSILFQIIYLKEKLLFFSPFDMIDTTASMFSTLKDVSEATGGMAHVTINPTATFKRAIEASENYYLLYYYPKAYEADGKFRKIKVKVKGRNYKVIHRAGYIAD
jgi:VWFA-related protein